ncbi:uncharacterized protein LOC126824948 [Patella vulgata]|uniref:uncharacterized protein LOC126824948 n=1 Tax=Patella vulgata TaxID=6465 RepID=UPI00217F831F|nr:uncharacterized protein LOC126824948 [Patella vulgata]
MTGTKKTSPLLKLPNLTSNDTGCRSDYTESTLMIETPAIDQLQTHREDVRLFQENYRCYGRENEIKTINQIHKIKQDLNKAMPFRLQTRNQDNTPTGTAKAPETSSSSTYAKRTKYHRMSRNNFLRNDSASGDSFQWSQITDQVVINGQLSTPTLRPRRKRPKWPPGLQNESSTPSFSHKYADQVLPGLGTSENRPPQLYPEHTHKCFGPSSKIKPIKTLGCVLAKHGYDMTDPRTSGVSGRPTQYCHSDKYMASRINTNIIDTTCYDEFSRISETIRPDDKLPSFTPRTNDYSLSRSEMGRCFPVFTSDGGPMRKHGHVGPLSPGRSSNI